MIQKLDKKSTSDGLLILLLPILETVFNCNLNFEDIFGGAWILGFTVYILLDWRLGLIKGKTTHFSVRRYPWNFTLDGT